MIWRKHAPLLRFIAVALTVFSVAVAIGCREDDTPDVDTTDETAVTTEEGTAPALTEPDTADPDLPPETDGETVDETAAETAPETEPQSASAIRLDGALSLTQYAILSRVEATIVEDAEAGEVLHLTAESQSSPRITLRYDRYAEDNGLSPIDPNELAYIVVKIKKDNLNVNTLHLACGTDEINIGRFSMIAASYDGSEEGWQYAVFDFTGYNWRGSTALEKLALEYTDSQNAAGNGIYVASIYLATSVNEVMAETGREHLTLGYGSDITVAESDPVQHTAVTAPAEDGSVSLWFDHITEKYAQTQTVSTGREGYTIRLAKNDISACQLVLAPEDDRTFRVEVGTLTHEDGTSTLDTSLYFGYYTNVRGTMQVDAIPPVQEGMTFAVQGGQSQSFVIKAKSTAESQAGLYTAEVRVYDDATGDCVRVAKVYAYVWDFVLSDETAMTVTGSLVSEFLTYAYEGTGADTKTLYKNYYDFLLENRIVPYSLPFDPVTELEEAKAYLDNPRVTVLELPNKRDAAYHIRAWNEVFKDNATWLNKVMFYYYDEPHSAEYCGEVAGWQTIMDDYFPHCRWLCPYFTNFDMTMLDGNPDLTEYFSATMGVWCTKINSYTPREVSFLPGTSYLQTEARDAQYGEFSDRMMAEAAGGDWVWTYFCWEPNRPYANWMADSDGCEAVVTSWQCYQNGITGQLFWWFNEWRMDYANPYDDITSTILGENSWGDGILIYPGVKYGMDTPVASIRLDQVREGIEDYQMLTMLEELVGKEKADELVLLVTNTVVNFTDDDDYLNAVRVMLGDMVEAAVKGE